MTDFSEEQVNQALIRNNGWNYKDYFHDINENTFQPLLSIHRKIILFYTILFLFVSFDVASKELADSVFKYKNQTDPVFEFQERYKGQTVYSLKVTVQTPTKIKLHQPPAPEVI